MLDECEQMCLMPVTDGIYDMCLELDVCCGTVGVHQQVHEIDRCTFIHTYLSIYLYIYMYVYIHIHRQVCFPAQVATDKYR